MAMPGSIQFPDPPLSVAQAAIKNLERELELDDFAPPDNTDKMQRVLQDEPAQGKFNDFHAAL